MISNYKSQSLNNSKFLAALLCLITLFIYGQSFFFQLIYFDDNVLLKNVSSVTTLSSKIAHAFTSNYLDGHYYRPLTIISLSIDSVVGNGSIYLFHLVNVILHLITELVLFSLLQKMKYSKQIAFICSLLFAITSVQVNAVAWIAGRADLLVGMFAVISFTYFLHYRESGKIWYSILFIIATALAILSKETALILPIVFASYLVLDKYSEKNKTKIYFVLAELALLILVYIQLRVSLSNSVNKESLKIGNLFENLFIIPETISKIFLPIGIQALSGYSLIITITGILIALLLLTLPFILKNINKNRYFLAYSSFFLLMLPGLFFRTNPLDQSFYWDCRSYLPIIFMTLLLAEIVSALWDQMQTKKIFLLFVGYICFLLISTLIHLRKYENPEVYWRNVQSDYPQGYLSYSILSQYYFDMGNDLKAETYLLKAVNLSPRHIKLNEWLFNYYFGKKEYVKALSTVSSALKYFPTEPTFLHDLILIAAASKKIELIDEYYFKSTHDYISLSVLRKILIEETLLMEKFIDNSSKKMLRDRITRLDSMIEKVK